MISLALPHVVHVIDELPPDGAQRLIVDVLHNAGARFRYSVLCMVRGGALQAELESIGVPVHVLGRRPGLDPGAVPALLKWFKRHRPDIVHTHLYNADSYGRLAAWLARVPGIFTTRHSTVPWPSAPRRWIAQCLSRVTNTTIACGAEVERMLISEEGIGSARVKTIANGINLRRFVSADGGRLRHELGLEPDQLLVGVVGRLHPLKGHVDLIEAMAQLHREGVRFRCAFVGAGELHNDLTDQLTRSGLSDVVQLLGQRGDVVDVLAALDIFAMPSRREGLPMALLEAMAMARPVVATAVGSIPEVIVDGQNGVLVEPGRPSELTQALRRLLTSAAERERIGAAARKTVQDRYSSTQTARAYERLYEQTLSPHAATLEVRQ